MPALTFFDARATVIRETRSRACLPLVESLPLDACFGRVLAEDAPADRNYPPFNRAMRDGFAVRAADVPGTLRVTGEVRAGQRFTGTLQPREAIEIMTGAPVPLGADAVVMIEQTIPQDNGSVRFDQPTVIGANISPEGCEARTGSVPLARGTRLDYSGIAWLAMTGQSVVRVYQKPKVAIIATGDEIVGIGEKPAVHQIRNSNAYSLAAQVARAGGELVMLPVAPDTLAATRTVIEQGLKADLLLLSGGVSAGKYDVVEPALAELGATFFFDRVLIQPGAPVVFGTARKRLFFGLPGNPSSTMVTFEVFARAALSLCSGEKDAELPLALARMTRPFRHKPGLTRFLPAVVSCGEVTPVDSRGSGDVASLAQANAYLVADARKPEYAEGDLIPVMFK